MTSNTSKIIMLFGCLTLLSCQNNDIIVKDLTLDMLPNNVSYKGKLIEAKKWTDKNGDNYLIISRFGPYRTPDPNSSDNDFGNVELNACHYLIKNNSISTLWQTSEAIKNCGSDIWIGLFPNSTAITDLNKNGITETTIVYKYFCRGDVSPANLKVILHEGKKTYSLKGSMYSEYGVGKLDKATFEFNSQKVSDDVTKKYINHTFTVNYGRYADDLDFKDASPEFMIFVKTKWIEYCDKDSFNQFSKTDYDEALSVEKHAP
jgi:hypothetical protein